MEKSKTVFICIGLFFILFISFGCSKNIIIETETKTLPSLDILTKGNIRNINNNLTVDLLNRAYTAENKTDYWVPGMTRLLLAKKMVPRQHLKYFLKECNMEKFRNAYDQAVFLWFKDIVDKKEQYKHKDKAFLENYISRCIDYCADGDCACLNTGREIAKNIDRELYNAIWKESSFID